MKKSHRHCMSFSFYVTVVCVMISLAYLGSKAVNVMFENAPVEPKYIVIIDAGHGGIDGGATSCTGVLEKDINLQIAKRLNDLMNLLGIHTIMIRTDDRSVHVSGDTIAAKKVSDLKERVRIVNETQGCLLVSIHQNYFPESKYSGTQVFYAPTNGSEELGRTLQKSFTEILNPEIDRQAKKASGIYLMEHINAPGILIECGFISNVQEEAKLRTAMYQKKISCIIAAQVSNHVKLGNVA